ncbi:hypothetical protein LZZ85_25705 [Terrimonas sp. NA20]|uniref:Uncharacterized protein n=1 Tax=Terrimonas ginsenosidimutans TaxID=2908004 RepID=A0ABS9KZI5_9BACT|nr:hypothetical protein [Terrimonas ginsenosidimutans]MCG2617723.1 hypothetical protein [Terrimonas ginsenosidimutans]
MRSVFIVLIAAVIIGGCSAGKQSTASPIGLVPLEHYYAGINNSFDTGYNYRVITDQSSFEKDLKVSASSGASVRKPEFSGQTVVAVIHNGPPNQRKEIVLDGAAYNGSQMYVYYHIKETLRSPVTTYLPGLGLATVPKVQSVKKVNFYEDSVLVKSVPVSIY